MIDVVDRVPTKPNEYIAEDLGNGRVRLTRADEPLEEGTPINKAFFTSIKYDLTEKLVKFTQPTPTIIRYDPPHVTTVWLSDSHTEKYNYVDIFSSGAGGHFNLKGDINFDLQYNNIIGYNTSYGMFYFDSIPVDGVITIEKSYNIGAGLTYFITLKFDGYKLVVEQSYTTTGTQETQLGGWETVRILCKGRLE